MRKNKHKKTKWILFLLLIVVAGFTIRNIPGDRKEVNTESVQQDRTDIQEELNELLEKNPELADFVAGYAASDGSVTGGFSEEEKNEEFPLFLQWDARWGYAPYGESCIGISGCAPTCLSMIIFSLTRDESATPDKLADYGMKNGYYAAGIGTEWSFLTDAPKKYGITSSEIGLDETAIKKELDKGHPIIVSLRPGDFTVSGHFIVIYGYTQEGFLIHDPNSRIRSSEAWTFEVLKPQIKNLWFYSYDS